MVTTITTIPKLPDRRIDANKGDFGKILIIGGSQSMIGAPALAANAALRSGAGLVTVACPAPIQPFVLTLAPCATSIPLPQNDNGCISEKAIPVLVQAVIQHRRFDAVAIGPGMGPANLNSLITLFLQNQITMVIDADALNELAKISWNGLLSGPCVITPHPGELSRLLKVSVADIQSDRKSFTVRTAERMSSSHADQSSVCLLKGHQTVVTDGERCYINQTGNPGLATGGTGDVLTGIITALAGQGLSPFDAAVLGAYVHGHSGDLAAQQLGQRSLTAADLNDFIPHAFKSLKA